MTAASSFSSPGSFVRIYAVILAIVALVLVSQGGRLVLLGGSPYYLLAGVTLAASALFVFRGRREGLRIYVGLVFATVAWSLWEVGLDPWQLMPRLAAWVVLGAVLATPTFRRYLRSGMTSSPLLGGIRGWWGLVVGTVAAVVVGGVAHEMRAGRFDPRFQTGYTEFPEVRAAVSDPSPNEWRVWGRDGASTRYSPLTGITPDNVHRLERVWTAPVGISPLAKAAGVEATPLMVGKTLYTCNGLNEIFAIDAETGKRLWAADPTGGRGHICRGVAFHESNSVSGRCAKRIISATGDATLVAYDAVTGEACGGFGDKGSVNLLKGMSEAPKGYYYVTSAPALVRGNIIIGGWVTDGQFWGEPSGVIRAYDALSGELAWAWDMGVPERAGAPGPGETYTPSTPNSWAPISVDEESGLVYLPIGNSVPDYFGAQRRSFDETYSSGTLALDASTGRERWHFQTTHHDIWDYDTATPPVLVDLPQAGGTSVRAVVQATKRGEIFILDALTGQPLRMVEERSVPQADAVPDEKLSPTQPFSPQLPSFRGADLEERDMWGLTPIDQLSCRILFRQSRYDGHLTPPGTDYWLTTPGTVGGMNWGSVSVDPVHKVMVTLSGRIANRSRLIPRSEANELGYKPVGDGSLAHAGGGAQMGTPYAAEVNFFLSPLFAPCQAPPYGFISAIDLVTGKLIWSRPIGTMRDIGPFGIATGLPLPMGTFTIGGPMLTGSGLVFTAATADRTIRALDIRTGKQLWQAYLPHGGFSVPMTYVGGSGRQFVVLSTGSLYGLGKPDGASLIAFALGGDAKVSDGKPPPLSSGPDVR